MLNCADTMKLTVADRQTFFICSSKVMSSVIEIKISVRRRKKAYVKTTDGGKKEYTVVGTRVMKHHSFFFCVLISLCFAVRCTFTTQRSRKQNEVSSAPVELTNKQRKDTTTKI